MSPEEIKAAARKELARRELERRQAEAQDVSRETLPAGPAEPSYVPYIQSRMKMLRDPDFEGMAGRATDLARGIAEGATFGYADEIAAALDATLGLGPLGAEGYQANVEAQRARDIASDPAARLGGNVLGALATGRALPRPETLRQALGYAAGGGALAGSGFAEGGPQERLGGAALGAVTGPAISAPIYGLSNVVAPRVGQALQTLRRQGVRPTIGQMAGGAASRLEESAMSIPGLGSVIRGARLRALEDFNRGAINHALRPAGLSLKAGTEAGRKAIAEADDLLSKGYNEALDQITDATVDSTFAQQIANLRTMTQERLGRKGQRAFDNALQDVVSHPSMQKPTFSGKEIKHAISGLRRDMERLMKSTDEDTYQAGLLVREARDALSDLMKRNTTPDNAARLTGLDRARAGFGRVRDASEAGREGIFTPFQLSQAVKRGERASGRRGFARGEGLGQELAEAGEEVISSRVPDSGTPERLLPYILAAGAGGAYGAGYIDPGTAALVGSAALPYTRGGQNVLARLVGRTPSAGGQVLAEGLRRSVLPVAVGGAAATGQQ